jgi:hypothetical protein
VVHVFPFDSKNKQWLFPETSLTKWSLSWGGGGCSMFPTRRKWVLKNYVEKTCVSTSYTFLKTLEPICVIAMYSSLSIAKVTNVGAIPQLPHISSWVDALLINHRNRFIYSYIWLCSLLLDLGCFLISWPFTQPVGLLGWGSVRRKAATFTQNSTNTEYTHTDIHASSGIRTHDPNVWAGEDSPCLRSCGHCDRHRNNFYNK